MFFVFGSRLMGKVDEVPGMFHVATKFGHINFLPLIPMQSYIVIAQNGGNFRGMPISLSGRSILFAWGRVAAFFGCIVGAIWGLADYGISGSLWPALAILAVASAGIFYLLMWHKPMRRASFNRANELATMLRLGSGAFERIQALYGESSGRGFDVLPVEPVQSLTPPAEGPPTIE